MRKKHAKIILLLLLMPAVSVMLFYRARSAPSRAEQSCFQHRTLSEQRMQIKGLRFSDYVRGEKTLDIRADELTIEKMKMGHFRFSLFNVARLKNVEVDLFGEPANVPGNPDALDPREVIFEGSLGKASLSSLGIKRISSLKAEPVRVRLYSQDQLITSISAASAQFDLNDGGISFKGNVSVVSESREIQSGALMFTPEKTSFEVGGPYRLKDNSGRTTVGKGLSCDLFLRPVRPFTDQIQGPYKKMNAEGTWLRQSTSRQDESRLPPGF